MIIRPIDELNTMSVEPEEYFGEMNLTKEQIDERIQFTKDANDALLDTMYLMATMGDYGDIDYPYVQRQLEDRWAALIESYVILDDYLMQYARDYAENFVDATKRHEDNEWYFSEDRALFGAENAANDTLNYKDYIQAIEDGYTHKKWLTEHDMKVRQTHSVLHGQVIGIEEYFVVGGALMRFPKDYELAFDAPRELVNCRCTVRYINKGAETSTTYSDRERSLRNRSDSNYNVDWHEVRSKEYTERFSNLSDNEKTQALIAKRSRRALVNRDGKNTEELYAVSLTRGTDVSAITDQNIAFGVERTTKFNADVNRATANGEEVLLIHNHPAGTPPSVDDINALFQHENTAGITVGHNGSIYYYSKADAIIEQREFDVAYLHYKEYSEITAREMALERLAEKYHFVFKRM